LPSWLHENTISSATEASLRQGRLDLNSTGLLIFTKSGVLAKKLVSTSGKIEKEYIITVEKAQQLMPSN
jgi:16S rRNA U516 pseudouridylate synthase RsuA-like enzyme